MEETAKTNIRTVSVTSRIVGTSRRRLIARNAGWWTSLYLAVADALSVTLAALMAFWFRVLLAKTAAIFALAGGAGVLGAFSPSAYYHLWPLVALFVLTYALRGLYPAIGLGPVEETRRLSISTTMVVLGLATYTFLAGVSQIYSRAVFLIFWPLALASVPLGRWVVRLVAARYLPWGEPVAIIGPEKYCARLIERLVNQKALGLRPIVCFATSSDGGQALSTVMTAHSLDELARISQHRGIRCAIIANGPLVQIDDYSLDPYERLFPRTILVAERADIDLSWVSTRDIGGILGLETRNNLLSRWAQVQKRAIDIVLALITLVIAAPLGALIAMAVRLDSPGPVFYTRLRVGKGGKLFKMLKFRSMHQDADELLDVLLRESPELLRQWQKYQKIRDDPRVTRVGKLLRKYSLDELPQFINVLKGEMSIVGPRPFLPEQEDEYGSAFRHYSRVSPGISGLWQVNGRNQATFSDRATLDERYVRNWSIWLDLYILAKTPWVVLTRHGAY